MLADASIGFLAPDRGEWTADGKNYVNGLFKMLHTHGSHPGLSDEDHCTFCHMWNDPPGKGFFRRLITWERCGHMYGLSARLWTAGLDEVRDASG